MAVSLYDAGSRKHQAKLELATWRLEYRRLKQKKQRLSARGRCRDFSDVLASKRAWLVYAFNSWSPEAAADFVYSRGRACVCDHEPCSAEVEAVRRALQSAFAKQMGAQGCEAIISGSAKKDQVHACRFLLERNLYQYIFAQNSVHGVAPSRQQLIDKTLELLSSQTHVPEEVQAVVRRPLTSRARTQRKWLASFRARWGARIGAVKVQEHVPLEEMREKAWCAGKFGG